MALLTQREQVLPPREALSGISNPGAEPERVRAPWPSRFLPSLTDVMFLLPLWFVVASPQGVGYMLGDGDTGVHIRTGEWILANGKIPHQDLFSFTKGGQPWFAWEWLWEAGFGWLHQHGGMTAVVLASMVIMAGAFTLLYRVARWRSGQPLVAFAVTLLAVGVSSIHWLARPHLVTWLLVAVFVWLLEEAAAGKPRRLIWVPPLMAVWTNLHGGFVAGLLIVASYAGGELIGGLVARAGQERRAAFARSRRYGLTLALAAAATLLNPYGWKLHAHMAQFLGDPVQFNTILEYLSPNFHHPMAIYFEAIIVLAVAASIWEVIEGRFVYPLLLVGWVHLALFMARNLPLLALVSVVPASVLLARALERIEQGDLARWLRRTAAAIQRVGAEVGAIERLPRIPVISAASVALLGWLMWAPPSPALVAQYADERYPARAVEYLNQAGWVDRIYTDDEWGDYLIYRGYPRIKAYTDGRSDFYGDKFLEEYGVTLRGEWKWEQPLNRYRIETVLVPVNSPLASTLKESARWRLVYDDHVANIFRRADAPAGPAGEKPFTAIPSGGSSAIARSHSINKPVIPGSQSYARR